MFPPSPWPSRLIGGATRKGHVEHHPRLLHQRAVIKNRATHKPLSMQITTPLPRLLHLSRHSPSQRALLHACKPLHDDHAHINLPTSLIMHAQSSELIMHALRASITNLLLINHLHDLTRHLATSHFMAANLCLHLQILADRPWCTTDTHEHNLGLDTTHDTK